LLRLARQRHLLLDVGLGFERETGALEALFAVDTMRGAYSALRSQGIARGNRQDGRGDGSALERATVPIGGTGSKQKSGGHKPAHPRTKDCQ